MKQRTYFGWNSHENIRSIVRKHSPKKIFLVTGKGSYSSSGAKSILSDILKPFTTVRFADFDPNPSIDSVDRATACYKKENCDFIIGIGGGSVMDVAKAVSLLATQTGSAMNLVEGRTHPKARKIPSVMIPTTAGSGSEATSTAVVYVKKTKYSLHHESMLPDYAVLDASFTESLTPYQAACSGMDALCQAIESYWSVGSTPVSKKHSGKAVKMIMPHLAANVNNPDKSTREKTLLGSHFSGKAINITRTTAAHAISYPMTSFFGIPHGHAVALSLPYFFEINFGVDDKTLQDERGINYVRSNIRSLLKVLEVGSPLQARQKIQALMKSIGMETRLSGLGIDEQGIEIILKHGPNPQRMKNNPRKIIRKDIRLLFEKIK